MANLSEPPKEKEFEEFISAIFQCSGFYTERNIIEREEKEEILELDIVATNYDEKKPKTLIIEAKSGSWGFSDIFKIKGWIDYLGYSNGLLTTIKPKEKADFYDRKASEIGTILIQIDDSSRAPEILSKAISCDLPIEEDLKIWRYSYWLERNLLNDLKTNKKKFYPNINSFQRLDEYYFLLNSVIFFSESIVERMQKLYEAFTNFPHISAKCGNELMGNSFDDDIDQLCPEIFQNTYYDCIYNVIQISTFIEHRARLALLKSTVDYLLGRRDRRYRKEKSFGEDFEKELLKSLPDSFEERMQQLESHKYFYKYPIFWQWFMWVFGGFILKDYEQQEYEQLSQKTGIPYEEISNAFQSYQILFPQEDNEWFLDLLPISNSNIKILKMFSIPFMGIGVNYRLLLYSENKEFEGLSLTGSFTMNDLKKWDSLLGKVLRI